MNAAEAVIQCLKEENIKVVFGYPGATVVPLYEALRKSDINHILVRHEQAAGHSASGYARANQTVGVCIATSGPGATNLITAIATAYMDSIPLVVITGQVKLNMIGKDVFQEADITGAAESFTKHSYLIKNVNDIPKAIKEAFYIARTGRPGPVLIDIPVDILNQQIDFSYPEGVNIRGYKPTINGHKGQIKKALQRISESKRPLICIGGGIISGGAKKELKEFVEKSRIPVIHTLMGKSGISEDSPYYIGLIGMHGFSYANKAVQETDLLILIGTRVGDRATSGFEYFAKNADIIHIDIDPAEIGKNLGPNIPIVGHSKIILKELYQGVKPVDTDEWIKRIESIKKESKVKKSSKDNVSPKYILNRMSEIIEDDAIVTADVGQNQIWCARNYNNNGNRDFFTSGGLGTMGYSLPAAVGAKIAAPERRVIAVVGDGGFQMSMFELGTIAEYNVNIIILLFNNSGLGMVREIQNNTYGSGKNSGVQINKNPDFVKIAEAYGLKGKKVISNKEFDQAFNEAINSDCTFLLECIIDQNESTL